MLRLLSRSLRPRALAQLRAAARLRTAVAARVASHPQALQQLARAVSTCVAVRTPSFGAAATAAPTSRTGAGPAAAIATDLLPAGNTSAHQSQYRASVLNANEFWRDEALKRVTWSKPFSTVQNHNLNSGLISWFGDGELNASFNCLDRHLSTRASQTALIWERDEPGQSQHITYAQLFEDVNRCANALKRLGVRAGDTVSLYLPMTPYAAVAMLACARIGAVHSVVFAGFSAESLRDRINDSHSRVLITADYGLRGGKQIPLKNIADQALKDCPSVQHVLVWQRGADKTDAFAKPAVGAAQYAMKAGRDVDLQTAMRAERPFCPPVPVNAEDPLFMLYTSGSTGKPKGLVHTTGGYLVNASLGFEHVFHTRPGDVFACMADVGWITGHTYIVYAPLLNGVTSLMFESLPTYPDASRYWRVVAEHRVTHFYTAPTAIRVLLKAGDAFVTPHDRSSLRVLGTVGEPIGSDAWQWYHRVVGDGRCGIVDTWWQTETGGTMMSPPINAEFQFPLTPGGKAHVQPGAATQPFFGVAPVVLDHSGKELTGNGVEGILAIRHPTPGMARTILGDHSRYVETYWKPFPGMYFTGDGVRRDAHGHYWITGRVDDVINVSGHRLGTAEVESALGTDECVAESAVVGMPHDIKGEGIFAFVTLKDTPAVKAKARDALLKEMKDAVRRVIGGLAVPDVIVLCPALPKTRSGKVMRRVLRKIATSTPAAPVQVAALGDLSTLADPDVVAQIVALRHAMFDADKKKDA